MQLTPVCELRYRMIVHSGLFRNGLDDWGKCPRPRLFITLAMPLFRST